GGLFEAQLRKLLDGANAATDSPIATLTVLTAAARPRLLVEWNDSGMPYPRVCLHDLIAEHVRARPGAVAVRFDEEQLTYAELDARANRLAQHLRGLGVGPEVLVGICVERSLEMMVGLLGVSKAGGA